MNISSIKIYFSFKNNSSNNIPNLGEFIFANSPYLGWQWSGIGTMTNGNTPYPSFIELTGPSEYGNIIHTFIKDRINIYEQVYKEALLTIDHENVLITE